LEISLECPAVGCCPGFPLRFAWAPSPSPPKSPGTNLRGNPGQQPATRDQPQLKPPVDPLRQSARGLPATPRCADAHSGRAVWFRDDQFVGPSEVPPVQERDVGQACPRQDPLCFELFYRAIRTSIQTIERSESGKGFRPLCQGWGADSRGPHERAGRLSTSSPVTSLSLARAIRRS